MKMRMSWAIARAVLLGAALAVSSAWAQEEFHARVSFDAGGTLIQGHDDADWSHATVNTLVLGGDSLWTDKEGTTELEMAGGSFLRMADSSKAEISSLPPNANVRAYTGSFYVHRLRRSSGMFRLTTPAAAVDIANDTSVRIDIGAQGSTTVSVHWGRVTVRVEGGSGETAGESQRIYADPGMLPSDPEPFNISSEDDFDQWNRERTASLVEGVKRVPAEVAVQDTTVGVSDLAPYGEWVRVDNRPCWRPTVVADYVPYRSGHWSYIPGVGYTWVEEYPFSYVTTHYGRWIYNPSYGWVWGYDPVWSPAWCATVHYGDNLLWSPIGFDNRPVVTTTSATFSVGGVMFSVAASSFVPASATYYGGPVIRPVTPVIVQHVPPAQINIWNITVNNYNNPVHVPYVAKDLRIREIRPPVITRGPATFGAMAIKASERARTLESKTAVGKFDAPVKVDPNAARTRIKPPQERAAALRSVRIQPEQKIFRTQEGKTIEAKPLVKRGGSDLPQGGKPEAKPIVTNAPDKDKGPDKSELRGPDKSPGARDREHAPADNAVKTDPKTGKPVITTDNAKDKAPGVEKTPSRNPAGNRVVDTNHGADSTKTDATQGKTPARNRGPVEDNKTGISGGNDAPKSDALTGKPQTKTRGPVEGSKPNMSTNDAGGSKGDALTGKPQTTPRGGSKTPIVDTKTSGDTGASTSGDRRKTPGSSREITTKPSGGDASSSKTGPAPRRLGPGADDNAVKGPGKFSPSNQSPTVDSAKGKTPPSTSAPDAARGKGTIRDPNADKNTRTKKSNGKSGNDDSDESSDEKKR